MAGASSVAIAVGSVLVLLGLMALIKRQAASCNWSAEVQRKLVHVSAGLYALTLPWLFAERWPVYMLVGISIAVLLLLRRPAIADSGLGSTIHSVDRSSYGDVLLVAAIGLTYFLADGVLLLYVLPMAVVTLADAAAALAGSAYGRRFFRVESGQKSLEGTAIFFLVTLAICLCCLLLLSALPRTSVVVFAVTIAAFATLIEADSWRGFDNLFIPMGLLVFLNWNLMRPPEELAIAAAILVAALAFPFAVRARWAIDHHAIRVYLVIGFLIWSVAELQNTVLPVLALLAYGWANASAPCNARYPQLDAAVAIALISIGWLVLGDAIGPTAVSFYGLTALGLCIALGTLAASPLRGWRWIAASLAMSCGLVAGYVALIGINPEPSRWSGMERPLALATLAVVLAPVLMCPSWFASARAAKVSSLALVVPLPAYLILASRYGGGL
jgi:phytol kinase